MIKQVPSYQTRDGELFASKAEALMHEFQLEVRGFIQSKDPHNRSGSVSLLDVSQTIAKDFESFYEMMKGYKQKGITITKAKTLTPKQELIPA